MSRIGNSSIAVTLSVASPGVTLAGTIDAVGSIATYNINDHGSLTPATIYGAVFGPKGQDFTIHNTGTVFSTDSNGADFGIVLAAVGTIANSGSIVADSGIALFGTAPGAEITNTGLIAATVADGIFASGSASLINSGEIKGVTAGAYLARGGDITNKKGGTISGATGVFLAAPGYVTNQKGATINASGDAIKAAATLASGSLAGSSYIYNDGLILAGSVAVTFASGSAYNSGNISAAVIGIFGGSDANDGNNGLAPVVYNYQSGTIAGSLVGVELIGANSYIYNQGLMTGQDGAAILGGVVTNLGAMRGVGTYSAGLAAEQCTVYNYGSITGTAGGVKLFGGALYNSGVIATTNASTLAFGLEVIGSLAAGTGTGYVYNYKGATISSNNIGLAAEYAVVVNYGLISGASAGAFIENAIMTNFGTIDGAVTLESGTLIESGLLKGSGGIAVDAAYDRASLLIIDSGATIIGSVSLGGSALEIAAGGAEKISALQYSGIGTLIVDSAANLRLTGGSFGPSIGLRNAGLVTLEAATTLTLASLSGSGTIDLTKQSDLQLDGPSSKPVIDFTATGATFALGSLTSFAGKLENFAVGDTIDLTGISLSAVESISLTAGILTVTDTAGSYTLTFASPTSFKGENFSAFSLGAGIGLTLASTLASVATAFGHETFLLTAEGAGVFITPNPTSPTILTPTASPLASFGLPVYEHPLTTNPLPASSAPAATTISLPTHAGFITTFIQKSPDPAPNLTLAG